MDGINGDYILPRSESLCAQQNFPMQASHLILSEVTVGVIQMRGNCCLCGCRTRSCQYIVSLQVKCSNKIVTFVLLDMLVMDKAFFRKIQIDTRMSLDWKVRYQESCPPAIPSVDDNAQFFCSPQCPQRCISARYFLGGYLYRQAGLCVRRL